MAPADHHHVACGHSNPPQPHDYKCSTNSQQRECSSCTPYHKDKVIAVGATGDCPLPEGMPLQQWFQSGQACGSALSLATHWKWLFVHQEVTAALCGHNFLSPFTCYFKLRVELLAAVRQNAGLTVQGVPITLFLSVYFLMHTHRGVHVCVCVYLFQQISAHACTQLLLQLKGLSGQASTEDTCICLCHPHADRAASRAASVTCSSVAPAGEHLLCAQHGLAKPLSWLPTQLVLETGPGSPREKNTCIYSSN